MIHTGFDLSDTLAAEKKSPAVEDEGDPAISRALHNKRKVRNSIIASRRRFIFPLHKDLSFLRYIGITVAGGGVAGR